MSNLTAFIAIKEALTLKKSTTIRTAFNVHRMLVWVSLLSLVMFVLSALAHPLMVWTGPQAKKAFPPKILEAQASGVQGHELTSRHLQKVSTILSQAVIEDSTLASDIPLTSLIQAKVLPSHDRVVLQLTTEHNHPRHYFSLDSTDEKKAFHTNTLPPNYDEYHAQWLARYYTQEQSPIKNVTFINEFTPDYPWVNRLLPVYKVEFERADQLTVYVHTETNALAAINNRWKTALQTFFRVFHTWSWLDELPLLRVGIITILLLSLLAACISGIVMMITIKRKVYKDAFQRYHRKMAWYVCLPLLGFLGSALFHLLQMEYAEPPAGLRLNQPVGWTALSPDSINTNAQLEPVIENALLASKRLNNISLVAYDSRWLLRVSIAPDNPETNLSDHQRRQQRFEGKSLEQSAIFFDYLTGENVAVTDKEIVEDKARRYLELSPTDEVALSLVTRFGPDYDFRNKRLPVWRAEVLGSHVGEKLFIDPATGILVEHMQAQGFQKSERWSFSYLHKWNMLKPLLGREGRDLSIVGFLLMLMFFGFAGYRLKRARVKNDQACTRVGQ
ncbi:PepSY domain-containing protein [Marinibactrum halimedae]|uniref:PepSY domain-containing protein n=1 Tax=Marinibactrum halimedae TaxID=1444977 RepID=A0AA37T3N2_9GAMM|nr:PepSY domain-containing protein [Marinibactrum halimedae]MCD9457710.1 PepSY domain-containing protein [Marinibactrum halimedae]GLS24916.1 hypothetical protein GCM10007877_06300 [Marinibactrum halimedae]